MEMRQSSEAQSETTLIGGASEISGRSSSWYAFSA
jgi:hypothetical protein